MSQTEFDRFYQVVLEDLSLQALLIPLDNQQRFIDCLVELGRKHGYMFDQVAVLKALQKQRTRWKEAWLA